MDASFLENSFQLDSLHERMTKLMSSPEQERVKTPEREPIEQSMKPEDTSKSVVHVKLNSFGQDECPSPNGGKRDPAKPSEDEFWDVDPNNDEEQHEGD